MSTPLIGVQNMAAPSSDEEEDLSQLQMIEQKLLAHDPSFTPQHTHASLASARSELISTLRPTYDEGNVEGLCRIHLNTERWRVCETWFSPSMAGVDSAGLGEVIQNVLAGFTDAEKGRLVQVLILLSYLSPLLTHSRAERVPYGRPVAVPRAGATAAGNAATDFAAGDGF
jgi:actin-related protein 5